MDEKKETNFSHISRRRTQLATFAYLIYLIVLMKHERQQPDSKVFEKAFNALSKISDMHFFGQLLANETK